ncbi:MAG TPA: hypothetical protein VGS41_11830, partial [Chthonomonadales bacterium]|nr:hypothetical protein [Chthonomonadales bacterium]
ELPLDDRRRRFVAERLRADLLERIDPDFGLVLSHWLGRCTCAASMLLLTIGTAYVLFAPDSRGLVLDNLAQLIALAPWLALAALLLTIFSGPVSLPLSMAADRIYRSRCRPLVMALGNLRHPFGVNALSAAYCVPELHDAAAPGLRSSIESLTSRHYGELGRDVVSNLCKALARSEAYDRVHLLYALEMIGDSRAIPLVARLAGRKDANAERTLAVLLERRAAEQASSLLLRASDAPVAAPQTLLRASNSSMDQEARMLLRQVGGDQTVLQEGS